MRKKITVELPDAVVEDLEQRARAHHESVDTEAAAFLLKGLATEQSERLKLLETIDKLHASLAPYPADFDIDEVINEGHK